MTNTVHYQGMALKQMDKELREKFSYNELNPLLNNKLDNSELEQIINNINIELEKRPTNEEIIQILNQKVDKKELAYYLESKPSTNDLYNNRKKIEENSRNIELIKDNIHNICSCGSALCGGDIQLQDQLRYVEVPSGRFIGQKRNGDNVRRIRGQLRDNSDVRRA